MADRHRLTIRSIDPDPRAASVLDGIEHLGLDPVGQIIVADIVFVDGDLESDAQHRLHAVLVDPLLQFGSWATPTTCAVEVTPLPGVTDAGAHAVEHAANVLGIDIRAAATGVRVEFPDEPSAEAISAVIERLVANDVIERWSHDTVDPFAHLPPEGPTAKADIVLLRSLSDDQLADLNTERGMSLDPEELAAIRSHFQGLDRDPTDVELETLAQTWSEHCAHKTFRARINIVAGPADDLGTQRPPLLGQLRQSTESLAAPFVVSSFVGNAGVVEFEQGTTLALKAETHNHPSAVEPFGGANTGVGGVIRDVLGIAHRPIAVTDILCFGPPELPLDELPTGTLHPRRIRAGVIDGIADYGNKIGLPTVAGAVLYDDRYTANPLVFAGCIGSAPTRGLHAGPYPGDRVVVLGGATGRDGIRGATFSSATMDATTGDVAGASVQIGDPITEKLLIDALVGAEDLYSAITDCGAGGLSSAIGEMAEGVGADVELDAVPRKYPGLAPWEVWLSEAQERMVVAVPADDLDVGNGHADVLAARPQLVEVVSWNSDDHPLLGL
ncbi:MAG: phosphoribosylformylglycinamidine synthase subunit PurS [Actinomycetota bacterium]